MSNKRVVMLCNHEEHKAIRIAAIESDLTVMEVVRDIVFGRRPQLEAYEAAPVDVTEAVEAPKTKPPKTKPPKPKSSPKTKRPPKKAEPEVMDDEELESLTDVLVKNESSRDYDWGDDDDDIGDPEDLDFND